METDVLGAPYERRTIVLADDDEGEVVGTLVRLRAAGPTKRAVLYVHGFVDYFFQTHLAEFFTARGYDFYALDLRKYGRSLLEPPDARTSAATSPSTTPRSTRRSGSSATRTATTRCSSTATPPAD